MGHGLLETQGACAGPAIGTAGYESASGCLVVTRAAAFAAERHAGQWAKGLPRKPYVNHLCEVARLVAEAGDGDDCELIAAAYLHDVVEKTATSLAEVEERFGPAIASLVAELTDDPKLSEEEQKAAQVVHAPHLSPRAKLIKIADKTSNLAAQATEPKEQWPHDKAARQLDWSKAVAAPCRGLAPRLDQAFDEAAGRFTVAFLADSGSASPGASQVKGPV